MQRRVRASLFALLFVVEALASAVACAPTGTPPPAAPAPAPPAGPNYSTVPCADNCGNDTQCLSRCQPVDENYPPPAALTPRR